jgi:hypothetical protein
MLREKSCSNLTVRQIATKLDRICTSVPQICIHTILISSQRWKLCKLSQITSKEKVWYFRRKMKTVTWQLPTVAKVEFYRVNSMRNCDTMSHAYCMEELWQNTVQWNFMFVKKILMVTMHFAASSGVLTGKRSFRSFSEKLLPGKWSFISCSEKLLL